VPFPSRGREGHFKRFASVASLLSPRPRPPPRRFRDSRPQLPPPLCASHWTLIRLLISALFDILATVKFANSIVNSCRRLNRTPSPPSSPSSQTCDGSAPFRPLGRYPTGDSSLTPLGGSNGSNPGNKMAVDHPKAGIYSATYSGVSYPVHSSCPFAANRRTARSPSTNTSSDPT
jgi:hypothetical protein